MKDSREVEFTLLHPYMRVCQFVSLTDIAEVFRKRKGTFLGLGDTLIEDAFSTCFFNVPIAIVKEDETGKIFHVCPQFLTFTEEKEAASEKFPCVVPVSRCTSLNIVV